MNLAQLQREAPKLTAVPRIAHRPRSVKTRRDPVSTWERHHLANRAAMAYLLAALLAFIGGSSVAAALADTAAVRVLAAAALLALVGAVASLMRASALRRRLAHDVRRGTVIDVNEHERRIA